MLSKLNTTRGFDRGERLLQAACQFLALSLEMTEDALRDASTYARRWTWKRCASKHVIRLSLGQLLFLAPPDLKGAA